jgi:hypothetical protein
VTTATQAQTRYDVAKAPSTPPGWNDANQRRLAAGVSVIRALLLAEAQRISEPSRGAPAGDESADGALATALDLEQRLVAAMPAPAALEMVAAAFGLTRFEWHVLLLCAAVELDGEAARLCAALHPSVEPVPTFGIALATLPEAHWSALAPASPLRRWRLVRLGASETLTGVALRIDERVLHHIVGLDQIDEQLAALSVAVEPAPPLTPAQHTLVKCVAAFWRADGAGDGLVQLCGADRSALRGIVRVAADAAGLQLMAMESADIPDNAVQRDVLARLWEREAALGSVALLIDAWSDGEAGGRAAADLALRTATPRVIATREPLRQLDRAHLRLDVGPVEAGDRIRLWEHALGSAAQRLNGGIEKAALQFRLGAGALAATAARVRSTLAVDAPADSSLRAMTVGISDDDASALLWDECRAAARGPLDGLAERIEPMAGWEQLVLPTPQHELLRQIAASVAHRTTVHDLWGFAAGRMRGLGITSLFAGASGTGKTLAAEVLAGELRLDLYRIDLSRVVSKYIGETEKNLSRVFDAAESGGAVLLFDEADALFGRRSEVKDSHDRFANIEVSYLLQRMEAYRGLAILTTNMKSALDPAFLRRIRFVVQFPFPDATQREQIWRCVLPAAAPLSGVDIQQLARLNVAGGSIRNIALNAAFLAAADASPVRMTHMLRAARAEYAKLEKPLTDAEIAKWR